MHNGHDESQSQPWLAMKVHSEGAPFSVANAFFVAALVIEIVFHRLLFRAFPSREYLQLQIGLAVVANHQ